MTPEEQLLALKFRIERLEELNLMQNNINEGMRQIMMIYKDLIEESQNKIKYLSENEKWR